MAPTNSEVSLALSVLDCAGAYARACELLRVGVYHSSAWKEAYEVYGLHTHWLVASIDGRPVGILPLVRQSNRHFGRRLVSLPWVDEAGAVGEPEAIGPLLEHAAQLASEYGSAFSVTVKQPISTQNLPELAAWNTDAGDKVLMRRQLSMPSDELWKELSPKVRNQVRKAEKSGLETKCGGVELVSDFFNVYCRNMRDLGSPAHSLKFFRVLLEVLADRAKIYCTCLDDVVIGAGIVLDNRASLDIPWASSLREYNRLCVNHSLYWKILSDACDAGYEWFHFGRSTIGSGQYKFKKQWGAEEAPLMWLNYSQSSDLGEADNAAALGEKNWHSLNHNPTSVFYPKNSLSSSLISK